MGKTYTAKVTLSCVKQHTCVACAVLLGACRALRSRGNPVAVAAAE